MSTCLLQKKWRQSVSTGKRQGMQTKPITPRSTAGLSVDGWFIAIPSNFCSTRTYEVKGSHRSSYWERPASLLCCSLDCGYRNSYLSIALLSNSWTMLQKVSQIRCPTSWPNFSSNQRYHRWEEVFSTQASYTGTLRSFRDIVTLTNSVYMDSFSFANRLILQMKRSMLETVIIKSGIGTLRCGNWKSPS